MLDRHTFDNRDEKSSLDSVWKFEFKLPNRKLLRAPIQITAKIL